MSSLRVFVTAILLAFFVSACTVQKSPITGSKRAYGYSWQQEVKIGKEADQQIQQQYGVYDDEEVQQYVDRIGQEVLEVSHMRREDTDPKYRETEFHFRVLNSPVVNAFALPGGYIYVTRGLLAHLKNEAQLAMVLGHEIAHVAARHASQRAFEQQLGQIALIGGAVAGEELLGIPGQSVLQLGSQAAQFLFLSYGRDDERESDQLGVEYAAMKSYEAEDGAGFFSALERISEQSGQSIPSWQSSHPDPSERATRIPELADQWREKGYEQNIENTDEYMSTIDGIIYGENPREGFSEDGNFYHPDLKFQFDYPDNWEIVNQPTLVAAVNEDQDAISLMEIDSETDSPESSVMNYVSQEGFSVQSQNTTQQNGLNSYQALAIATTEDGTEYRFLVYAVDYDGNIYRFTNYSLAEKFDSYRTNFEQTSYSFSELNDQDKLNREPVRLQAQKVDRSQSLSRFTDNLPMDITAEDVAILNQIDVDATIEQGNWIKIPRQ
ncbi:peptidase M48 [Aliifodinibius salipaludis]|uniref:Peptidase M48 n=1 Tax=Fodinibius salipaludis TaxID=2032627 RepID=A0A2A2GFL2_9BACT|nr:M48 family metalloprotease [Aliifodinibius salipaludis]PAU95727.1 peptidase M48 [Aliifodinibius salipaludis]